jgi:hypothetical protein
VAVVILLLALVLFAFAIAQRRRAGDARRAAAATVNLEVDAWGVKRWLADGRYEEVSWKELEEVRLITLPKGPWGERLRLVLDGGGERGCIIPFDVAESTDLLARLGARSGFDHRGLAAALDSTRTGSEVLWARTTT